MPREDPALPPGRNGRKRELVKRVWWFFVSQGVLMAYIKVL